MRVFLILIFVLAATPGATQLQTIAELGSEAKGDVTITECADSPPFSLEEVLRRTDLIVRGVLGGPGLSSVSEDGRALLTTFELLSPRVTNSGQQQPMQSARLTPLSFARRGGSIQIDGFTVSHRDCDGGPNLVEGDEILILLRNDRNTYSPVSHDMVFAIRNSVIEPLGRDPSLFRGRDVDSLIAELLALRNR